MPHAPVMVRYWKRSCPHCGKEFGTTFDMGAVRLGSGRRACLYCNREFADGSLEWPQLTTKQKRWFLFRGLPVFVLFFGIFAGMFIYAGITIPERSDAAFFAAACLLFIGALLLAGFYMFAWRQIKRSKHRHALKGQPNS
jgi:hypothetical protein